MTPRPDDHQIGLVVEGRGDIEAVRLVLQKHLQSRGDYRDVLGKPVSCLGRSKALMENGIEGKAAVAAARPGCRGVFVVLDSEGDPVCPLGPMLLTRAASVHGKPVRVALAVPNFEAWILASAETLDLPGAVYPSPRNPAAVLADALRPNKYVKPTWQPRLAARIDVGLARSRDTSLDRALTRFDELLAEIPT